MTREQRLQRQGEWLEEWLWRSKASQLPAIRARLRTRLRRHRFTVLEVLGQLSDEGLVLAIKKDFYSNEAFEELYRNRGRRLLFVWALTWGLKEADAEDLVQTVFVKLLIRRFGTYLERRKHSINFRAYLWRVARNQWVQDLRKRKPELLDSEFELSANGQTGLDWLVSKEQVGNIQKALAKLKELDRAVVLAALAEHSLDEIARMLGLTFSAVALRLHRARNALERLLDLPARNPSARDPT